MEYLFKQNRVGGDMKRNFEFCLQVKEQVSRLLSVPQTLHDWLQRAGEYETTFRRALHLRNGEGLRQQHSWHDGNMYLEFKPLRR
mmetsp:Transcript_10152/g.15398  ORF Transcript_10152/g.15398 Transcript_10152/m.15398 type:complete len:85 (+) Transcript_10152:490-744(+)